MNKILLIFFALIIPSAAAEMSHDPQEVSQGTTFTAWIDADEDVESITFYVCTLEDPHTCYKPQKMTRNESLNGRFQFEYDVKANDYPGYKYELEKQDNLGSISSKVKNCIGSDLRVIDSFLVI